MKRALIGCGIMKKELEQILNNTGEKFDTVWLDEELHSYPDKLHAELQKTIDSLNGYDEIVLSYGLCGNALIGIAATNCDIIYPVKDDCIDALMCDNCRLAQLRKDSFFVGRSWLCGKNRFGRSYERAVKKYGEERANRIYKIMYAHYENLVYMQTEGAVENEMNGAAHEMAERLNLDLVYEPAGLRIYEKLLTCRHEDNEIKRLKKGEAIRYEDFRNKLGA